MPRTAMNPTVNLIVFSMIMFIQMCNCRYVVPERPPLELKNLVNYQPDLEFRNHALRVGIIIANLLRSEIRLILRMTSTTKNGETHQNHAEGIINSHPNDKSEEHIHSEEIHSKESTPLEVRLPSNHHQLGNTPVKDPKGNNSHDIQIYNKEERYLEKAGTSEKTTKCVCPVVSASKVQPNTLMLEQKIYGASLSGEPLDSNSPVVVQRFIWNPHNVSRLPSDNPQQGQPSTDFLTNPVLSKSFTSTATPTPAINKKPSVHLDNQEHNIHLQNGTKPKKSTTTISETPKQTSYNPLAGLAETTESYLEISNPLDLKEQQGTQQEASDSLIDGPSDATVQGELPGNELVEKSITEKPPE